MQENMVKDTQTTSKTVRGVRDKMEAKVAQERETGKRLLQEAVLRDRQMRDKPVHGVSGVRKKMGPKDVNEEEREESAAWCKRASWPTTRWNPKFCKREGERKAPTLV